MESPPVAAEPGRPCADEEPFWEGSSPDSSFLRFELRLCNDSGASVYVDAYDWVRLFDSSGTPVSLTPECMLGGCNSCGTACDQFPQPVFKVETSEVLLNVWEGTIQTWQKDLCPGSNNECSVFEPAAAGSYRARFCFSRSQVSEMDLGPLECAEQEFRVPFDTAGVSQVFSF
jgi:hypothetical protein